MMSSFELYAVIMLALNWVVDITERKCMCTVDNGLLHNQKYLTLTKVTFINMTNLERLGALMFHGQNGLEA